MRYKEETGLLTDLTIITRTVQKIVSGN